MNQVLNILKENFSLNDENFKIVSKKTVKILVGENINRSQLIEKIKSHPGFTFEGKGSSSLGRLRYNDLILYVKPSHLQGNKSHGKANEDLFLDKISSHIKNNKLANIILIAALNVFIISNVVRIEDTSKTESTNYQKSDITLYNSEGKQFNISLKKDGGFRWESVRSRYKEIFNIFLDKARENKINNLILKEVEGFNGKYKMVNINNNKPYSKIIIDDFPESDIESIIFGEQTPKPIIVSKSFNENDFNTDESKLIINCSDIFIDVQQIKEKNLNPVMVFSHHIGKQYGIDFRALPRFGTIYGSRANVLHINYNELIK